ncbi:3043_t:CDS:10 [Cetraspora pellucida]|uniref:3043_t:CDS:1 n=1 Tax=Cetraspora pellucida TaxID=1433469 RepID=A0A9N9FPL5_9GLOM|nr:3043_t:CDS:10 [Cetraspora pellucida]
MLKASTSMSRSLDKRLDKQSDSQELLKAVPTFAARIQSNNQISTDNESEVRKPSDSEKEEQTKAEKNGLKPKAWKLVTEEETNGDVIKESNGTTIQHTSSDSPDNKASDKLDSPTSSSTPNDSSEMSSLSESPSLLHDDPKLKISNITATSITSEDESLSKMDASEHNRMCKKRRWDECDQNENEDDGSTPTVYKPEGMILFYFNPCLQIMYQNPKHNKDRIDLSEFTVTDAKEMHSFTNNLFLHVVMALQNVLIFIIFISTIEHDENDKPRVEVQEDLKVIERDFVQLRDQLYREQIQELDKEIAEIKQGVHPDQISCMDEIDKKRRKRSEITSSRKRYQELHCQRQYEESEYRTNRQFLSDRYALKRHILDDLENRRFKLIREKNNLDDSSRIEYVAPEQNYLKQLQEQRLHILKELKYLQDNHGFPADILFIRKKPLHADDIDEDFALMGISKETLVQVHDPSPLSTSPQIKYPDASPSGDRFLHSGQFFKKGDAVLVIDSTSGRYTAKFLAATDSEVVIQRPDGSKTRLQMNLLKEGKYQIHLKDSKES